MKQLYDCQIAQIYDEKREQMITAPVRTGAMDSLLVVLPRDFPLPPDGRTRIIFCSPHMGLVTCDCVLSAPYIEEDHRHCSYRCQILKQLSCEQRREDLKIPISASVRVRLEEEPKAAVKTPVTVTLEEDPDRREAPAMLRDISAGGVYLTTALQAGEGDHLSFLFKNAGSAMPLTAEILRVEPREGRGQPRYGYGCRFVNLPQQYESRLRNFVFQEEKRRRG